MAIKTEIISTKAPVISLESALSGLPDLYSPEGITLIRAYQKVFLPSVGKKVWLIRQLPVWKKQLNALPGVVVKSISLFTLMEKPDAFGSFCPPRPIKENGQIEIFLIFRGSIVTTGLGKKMGEAISGETKKELALSVIEECPPPFQPFALSIAKGTRDFLQFSCVARRLDTDSTREDRCLKNIVQRLKQRGAQYVSTSCKNFNNGQIVVRWNRDVTDEYRNSVAEEIKEILKDVDFLNDTGEGIQASFLVY